MIKRNKWLNGALPALLIHCSIGSVYAWSLFVNPISQAISKSQSSVQFAFSLAIFFLGMSAAFGGKIVEHNIKISTFVSVITFCLGLLFTGISIKYKSLIGIYLSYGCLMGIGLGIGYISPIKTLMMWFKDNKGLGTGIAITGFGFASAIASPIITFLLKRFSLSTSFYILSLIYVVPMCIAQILLYKPYNDFTDTKFKYSSMLKSSTFIKIWFIMYINISCGLALISIASLLLIDINTSTILVSIIIGIMGIFNGFGRLILSMISDKFKLRINMYNLIFIISIILSIMSFVFKQNIIIISIALFIISATYGAGFSCLPTLLSDKYGMNNISKIHGLALSSWAVAGLTGNQISSLVKNITGTYTYVFPVLFILYVVGLMLSLNIRYKWNK